MEASQMTSDFPRGNADYLIQRSILYKEVKKSKSKKKTIITREVKCEEIFTNKNDQSLAGGSQISIYNSIKNISVTINNKLCNNTDTFNYKLGFSSFFLPATSAFKETPMDIDDSNDNFDVLKDKSHSVHHKYPVKQLKIASNIDNAEVRSKLIHVKPEKSRMSVTCIVVFAALIILLGIFIIQTDMLLYTNKNVQIGNIKKELYEQVLSQEKAVETIIYHLEDEWSGIKTLPFIGSTGIGKTFTVNIIKKHFHPLQVHEIDRSKLDSYEKLPVFTNLKRYSDNIIIIDNLKVDDMNNLMKFIKHLPESYSVLIIPIFNIQHTDDGLVYHIGESDLSIIKNELEKSYSYFELVLFNSLKLQDVKKWLKMELHKRQVDSTKHASLIKTVLENSNVHYTGIKGINSKLLLALEKM